jgi:hypothetical protein
MGHFKLVYQSYPLDLPVEEPRITLRASSGSWPGQQLDDYVVLDLEVKSPKFFFDPNNDPEDDVGLPPQGDPFGMLVHARPEVLGFGGPGRLLKSSGSFDLPIMAQG